VVVFKRELFLFLVYFFLASFDNMAYSKNGGGSYDTGNIDRKGSLGSPNGVVSSLRF